jgi:hypothetical protein
MTHHETLRVTAVWGIETGDDSEPCGRYVAHEAGLSIWSYDGDEWVDTETGQPAAGEEFARATILLSGGPYDGAEVS